MDRFLNFGSYLFHPLWMPSVGMVFYFGFSPSYIEPGQQHALLLLITVLTIFIPLVFLFSMRYFKMISSIHLPNVNERKIPILFFTCITAIIINSVVDVYQTEYLYYFFSGIFFSGILASFLTMLKFKLSLHVLGVSGVSVFLFSYMYAIGEVNLVLLAFFIMAIGWTASSRLHLKAHNFSEICVGFLVGIIPQIYLFKALWLY